MRSSKKRDELLIESKNKGPIIEEILKPNDPCISEAWETPLLNNTSSVPFIVKIQTSKMSSKIKIRLASLVGQPIISFIFSRGSLSKFLLAKKIMVAKNAATDKISMKLIVNLLTRIKILT